MHTSPSYGDPAKPRSQKRQRPITATTRLTQAERDRLGHAADEADLSVSDFLRGLVKAATESITPEQIQHLHEAHAGVLPPPHCPGCRS